MDKEQIIQMMEEKGYQQMNCMYDCDSEEEKYLVTIDTPQIRMCFKPKSKFPIVFKDDVFTIIVNEFGSIQIDNTNDKIVGSFGVGISLPLLEEAVKKSREIRGLK